MTDITIPPEAVDEAARAMCETGNGPCKCLPDECGSIYWKAHALAALRAGIAAWPGMHERTSGHFPNGVTGHGATVERRLILPLPTENTNAEG